MRSTNVELIKFIDKHSMSPMYATAIQMN